jgi:hypothetical protein
VELAIPAAEAGARDEAAPWLADDGGAEEARRFVGWETEEDLFDELLRQQVRRRRRHAWMAARGEGLVGG